MLDELIEQAIEQKKIINKVDPRVTALDIDEETDKPVIYIFISDLHVGALGTDYEALRDLIKFLREHSYVKVIFGGDLYDNFLHFKSLKGANDSVYSPSVQLEIIALLVEELESRDQLRVLGLGNHGVNREEKAVGYSILKKRVVAVRHKIFEGMGFVNIKVGNEIYRGVISHKGKGHSHINPLHGGMRLARLANLPDFVFYGHEHVPASGIYVENRREIIVLKGGTYQTRSAYIEREYNIGVGGHIRTQMIIFFPDRHKKVFFDCPDDAILYYEALMGKYEKHDTK